MSVDILQQRIQKMKNPIVVDFSLLSEHIPAFLRENEGEVAAFSRFCRELMDGLQDKVPGVRFSFDYLALMGKGGLEALSELLHHAKNLGYYVLLDAPELLTPRTAERAADALFFADSLYPCDGLIVSPYIGTDAIKPFVPYCKEGQKDLIVALRTPNKSASDLQELMTGARHVYSAAADLICRFGDSTVGSCGYSHIGALAAATSMATLGELRSKYKRLFLLVDGCDYPAGSIKGCTPAFDRMGHGAAVSFGPMVTAAWYEAETDGADFVQQAVCAVERIKKNIGRYVTII